MIRFVQTIGSRDRSWHAASRQPDIALPMATSRVTRPARIQKTQRAALTARWHRGNKSVSARALYTKTTEKAKGIGLFSSFFAGRREVVEGNDRRRAFSTRFRARRIRVSGRPASLPCFDALQFIRPSCGEKCSRRPSREMTRPFDQTDSSPGSNASESRQ